VCQRLHGDLRVIVLSAVVQSCHRKVSRRRVQTVKGATCSMTEKVAQEKCKG